MAWVGRHPRFRPGQFVHLALDEYDPAGHWPESRAFSIASAPSSEHGIRLTISRQGEFTSRLLDELEPGRTLWCKGPYGEFEVRAAVAGAPVVLVAGGTGITPFCAFMEEALINPDIASGPVRLYYGARTVELLVYSGLSQRCAASLPGFEAFLFAEEGKLAGGVARGRLDIGGIADDSAEDPGTRFYLSGPNSMITSFAEYLREVRCLPPEMILIDAWE